MPWRAPLTQGGDGSGVGVEDLGHHLAAIAASITSRFCGFDELGAVDAAERHRVPSLVCEEAADFASETVEVCRFGQPRHPNHPPYHGLGHLHRSLKG